MMVLFKYGHSNNNRKSTASWAIKGKLMTFNSRPMDSYLLPVPRMRPFGFGTILQKGTLSA